jgi:hypothetical protein
MSDLLQEHSWGDLANESRWTAVEWIEALPPMERNSLSIETQLRLAQVDATLALVQRLDDLIEAIHRP